ncbi:uncharacterized protein LOC133287039 [Gastrolobium bilobum]|uniref:uncharacterized protein LOC133287039 n=1 Tax=Gastrolobium bilobum TaxID=150636 RepID=UPI002AAF5C6E|nr:uncharacterized protein LOC133287039 [Gastrolobium bilobum]
MGIKLISHANRFWVSNEAKEGDSESEVESFEQKDCTDRQQDEINATHFRSKGHTILVLLKYVKRKHLIDVSEVFRVLNAEKKFRIASYNCLQLLKSMGKDKQKSIDVFFKKKLVSESESSDAPTNIISESDAPSHEQPPSKCRRIEHTDDIITVKNKKFEHDPGKRKPIWEYSANEVDEIRRAYLIVGPYQPQCSYPFSKEKHPRRFQASWFKEFSSWLEYSPSIDAAFCLPCYLFNTKVGGRHGWDTFTIKGSSFIGHDETIDSRNRGNFIEMIKLLTSYNEKVADVVLKNAPLTAKYTSPQIQKDILYVLANKVRKHIRKEIGDSKFCIIVDEAHDESKREQMALGLRFVDKDGFIKERFFDLYHVQDTSSMTLKNAISKILSRHCLDIQNICGQGYDGASNMRGEWNGLQALFLNECPCAYYVHCFAHRLQLALIAASKEVSSIYQFFQNLNFIINIITASSKHHDQFQAAQISEFERSQTIGELETGTGSNQVGTLKRASDTRWSSHFYSICSLQRGYNESCSVLENIRSEGSNYSQRGDATAAYKMITSFEFIFNLLLMKEIMGITEILCQALQQKSQDILNSMQLVSSTKELIQELRNDGWKRILENVVTFSKLHEIDVPDLNAQYIEGLLSKQWNLSLSSSLDPKNGYKAFNVDDICSLAEKYYPLDFSEQERIHLNCQLKHFHKDIPKHPELQNLSLIFELCQGLAKTGKSNSYHLVGRLIRLILTLPVSTASRERAFSAMKIVKTRLRNKMEDDFLANNLVVYVERDIAETFTTDSILEEFVNLKERRLQF